MKILLLCSAGMSTSLLVRRMRQEAEKENINADIWACGDSESYVEIQKADVILIGPQMRFLEKKTQMIAGKNPVRVVDMMTYGRMDGKKALQMAMDALKEKHENE